MHDVPLKPTYGQNILYVFWSISFSNHKKLRSLCCLPCSTAGPLEAGLLQMESMEPMHHLDMVGLFSPLLN